MALRAPGAIENAKGREGEGHEEELAEGIKRRHFNPWRGDELRVLDERAWVAGGLGDAIK